MNKSIFLAVVPVIFVMVVVIFTMINHRPGNMNQPGSKGMTITSTAFQSDTAIPQRYECEGDGVNPPLAFDGVPSEAQALALVVDDPDAPSGTFDHWVLWNLPATLREIPENWEPEPGVSVGANGADKNSWYPPCPPSGTHHYHFKLYALDEKLDLAEGSSKGELEKAMQRHIVAQSELVGTYSK
ncbi:MAG TPA: YbhB/YbcL family Raf kinase inhibitor-like protein [Candidatus Saccharimonadia bacterium]|jgi:hypothetical protein